jgi:hypothetical protein
VVTATGRIATFGRSVPFTDARAGEWIVDEDPRGFFDLTYSGNLDPAAIRVALEGSYDLLETYLGQREIPHFILYPSDIPAGCFRTRTGEPIVFLNTPDGGQQKACNLALANRIYADSGYIVVEYPASSGPVEAIRQALFDVFFNPVWEGVDVPLWFRQGVKLVYLTEGKADLLNRSRQAVRSGQVFSIHELQAPPTGPLRSLWEAQSYGLVLYTATLTGVDGLFRFAANPSGRFETAYESLVGLSLETVLANWQNWLFSPQAESAYRYSVYMAETPTPTVTLSPTPFPPTPTPIPTSTATHTFTPTVTGVLSPTPTYTATPSRTPIPPTPTVTPRRAVSFVIGRTPERAPAASGPQFGFPTSRESLLTLLAGLVLIVTALLLIVGLGQRRPAPQPGQDNEPVRNDD